MLLKLIEGERHMSRKISGLAMDLIILIIMEKHCDCVLSIIGF